MLWDHDMLIAQVFDFSWLKSKSEPAKLWDLEHENSVWSAFKTFPTIIADESTCKCNMHPVVCNICNILFVIYYVTIYDICDSVTKIIKNIFCIKKVFYKLQINCEFTFLVGILIYVGSNCFSWIETLLLEIRNSF